MRAQTALGPQVKRDRSLPSVASCPHQGLGSRGLWGGLTSVVVVGGGEGALVDMVGQEAMQGVLEGGEGRLVVGVQD